MDNVAHKIKCPHCLTALRLVVSEFGGKVEVDPIAGATNKDKFDFVEHYKAVKDYVGSRGEAFDKTHRSRAFHYAKKILALVPVLETAKQAIEWTRDEYRRRGLGVDGGQGWNLGTVEKWLPDFLAWEAKQRAQARGPICCNCSKPAAEGAKVCTDCAWCYRCDDAQRADFKKDPKDMVPQADTPPICKDCAAALTK